MPLAPPDPVPWIAGCADIRLMQSSLAGARPNTILVYRSNLLDRHGRLAALVDPVRRASLDTVLLALSYEAPVEFGDHAQQIASLMGKWLGVEGHRLLAAAGRRAR